MLHGSRQPNMFLNFIKLLMLCDFVVAFIFVNSIYHMPVVWFLLPTMMLFYHFLVYLRLRFRIISQP